VHEQSSLDSFICCAWRSRALSFVTGFQAIHVHMIVVSCNIRADCVMLLTQCSNSSTVADAICNIIAPASTEEHCISLHQFLQPSVYGKDVISPIASLIDNPCDPNPCADGFFCSINRLCRSEDRTCTSYECQPGCVV